MQTQQIGVIGAGRVGSVLAAKFRRAGYSIAAVSGRSAATRLRVDTLLPGVQILEPAAVAAKSDVLILAVPDDNLIAVAEELAATGAVGPGMVVAHTSGRHGLEALAALTRIGARPIAFHPAMTFTGTSVDLDRTCVFGLTAGIDERQIAEDLVAALDGTPMWINEADRALYHGALAHGANHLTTLVAQSMDLLRKAGAADPSAVLRPLLSAALDNVLAYGDAALTGPVVRADVTTIGAHMDIFAEADVDPATVDAYAAMARSTARRAEASGQLSAKQARDVRRVLNEAEWDSLANTMTDDSERTS